MAINSSCFLPVINHSHYKGFEESSRVLILFCFVFCCCFLSSMILYISSLDLTPFVLSLVSFSVSHAIVSYLIFGLLLCYMFFIYYYFCGGYKPINKSISDITQVLFPAPPLSTTKKRAKQTHPRLYQRRINKIATLHATLSRTGGRRERELLPRKGAI